MIEIIGDSTDVFVSLEYRSGGIRASLKIDATTYLT